MSGGRRVSTRRASILPDVDNDECKKISDTLVPVIVKLKLKGVANSSHLKADRSPLKDLISVTNNSTMSRKNKEKSSNVSLAKKCGDDENLFEMEEEARCEGISNRRANRRVVMKQNQNDENETQSPVLKNQSQKKKRNDMRHLNIVDELDCSSGDEWNDIHEDDDSSTEEQSDESKSSESSFYDSCSPQKTPKRSKESEGGKRKGQEACSTSIAKSKSCNRNLDKDFKRKELDPSDFARLSLHVSNVKSLENGLQCSSKSKNHSIPACLPCRESEFGVIRDFILSKLLEIEVSEGECSGGCMYVSGVPGTGKTATVNQVVDYLKTIQNTDNVDDDFCACPDFQVVSINGMRLTEPRQAYVEIYKQLFSEEMERGMRKSVISAEFALNQLHTYFTENSSVDEKTKQRKKKNITKSKMAKDAVLLIVDELDMLCTDKQSILYNLFEWPTRAGACLIVVAIANTMNLPERIMAARVASRFGLSRLTFTPYTHTQLMRIVESRLLSNDENGGDKNTQNGKNCNTPKRVVFDSDSIQLVARKVASLSGDARRALDICRRAVEIASIRKKEDCVRIEDVIAAHEEMFQSPIMSTLRNTSVLEKAFLEAILATFVRSGVEESTFDRVYSALKDIWQVMSCKPPSSITNASSNSVNALPLPKSSVIFNVCCRLTSSRILLMDPQSIGAQTRIRLNISQSDLRFVLKDAIFTSQKS